jgi:PKD repeat protein
MPQAAPRRLPSATTEGTEHTENQPIPVNSVISVISVSSVVRQSLALVLATLIVAGFTTSPLLAAPPAGAGAAGTVSVTSDPAGAAVYVDGDFVGRTPVSVPRLSAGDHRVRVVKDGYLENARLIKVTSNRTDALRVRLTARASQNAAAQTPAAGGLRIVVIAGEDSVNIIQQKTAVPTIVEVRDRNNLPVAGASVLFLLGGGGGNVAVLNNGLNQVALTTNAAGRATVAVNPVSRGTIQLEVRASYMGQTGTATITQTNFETASEAAQAGKAPSTTSTTATTTAGGTAGGVGGGLSTGAIAGIVGGAAAGAIVGVKVITGRNKPPVVSSVTPSVTTALLGVGATVTFTAQASDPNNDSLTYTWDFGDGGTGTGASVTHTYSTAGTFTVKVTVSDGKDSVSNQTTVTIRSLTATWRSDAIMTVAGTVGMAFALTQSGSTLTGTFSQGAGTGPISDGSVKATSPRVTFTVTPSLTGQPFPPFTFTGDPSADFNTITGTLNGSGFVNTPLVIVRQ